MFQEAIGYVFTPANDRFGNRESLELVAKGKGSIYASGKSAQSGTCTEKMSRPISLTRYGKARNLAFYQSKLNAADAGRFSSAKNSRNHRLLKIIDLHIPVPDLASQQSGQLGIRYKMESASKIVAWDFVDSAATPDRHRPENLISLSSNRPTTGDPRASRKLLSQRPCLARLSRQTQ